MFILIGWRKGVLTAVVAENTTVEKIKESYGENYNMSLVSIVDKHGNELYARRRITSGGWGSGRLNYDKVENVK